MLTQSLSSPAKVNLTLRVLGRRGDGFHEIRSLVGLLEFGDEVALTTPGAGGDVAVSNTDPAVPGGEGNLAVRAARLFAAAVGVACPVHIQLRKRIPMGAGLGGGSSNAAAVLRGLNARLAAGGRPGSDKASGRPVRLDDGAGGPLTQAQLREIAAQIGSDVSLFLDGGPLAIIEGRGERVATIRRRPRAWAVLLLPAIHCDTSRVYAAWAAANGSRGASDAVERAVGREAENEVDAIVAELCEERPFKRAGLMARLVNDLEPAARAAFSAFDVFLSDVHAKVDAHWRMTGSGAAVFTLCASAEEAAEFAARAGRAWPELRIESTRLLREPLSPNLA